MDAHETLVKAGYWMPLPPFVIFAVALTLAVRFSSDSALTDGLARSLDASPASLREASLARSGCAPSPVTGTWR
jgi:hypothetical protein